MAISLSATAALTLLARLKHRGRIPSQLRVAANRLTECRPPLLLFLGSCIISHGFHGRTIDRQRCWLETLERNSPPSNQQRFDPHAELPQQIKITAVVIDPGKTERSTSLVQVRQIQRSSFSHEHLPTSVIFALQQGSHRPMTLHHGDVIVVEGFLELIGPLRNPHGFDLARWRHRQGCNLILRTYQPVDKQGVDPFRKPIAIMAQWRQSLRQKMTAGLETNAESSQLIRAVVLGERPPQPSRLVDDFRYSGTLHVFAVSGLHVGMVGSLIGFVLWLGRAPRWLIILLSLVGMSLYAGITGLRPPAVRAVIMASVFLTGYLLERRPNLINSLFVSAIIVLIWDGHQLFTPGFQLSYGVLLAIALLAHFWSQRLRALSATDPFMPPSLLTAGQTRRLEWRKKLQASLSISIAAWLGSTPLMWLHFGIITPIAILASLPLMLLIFVVLALAMLSLTVGAVWSRAGESVNSLNARVANFTQASAAYFAALPGSHVRYRPSAPQKGQVIVFDLPFGGGAQLIDIGGGTLLDCGSASSFRFHVLPTLEHIKRFPDSLIVSHADVQHSGAMSQCLELFQPKQTIIPRPDLRSPSYLSFLEQVNHQSENQPQCQLITAQCGQIFQLDPEYAGSYLEILHAPLRLDGQGLADDTGLVIRLHWHGWRILFTGDAGILTETRLLDSGLDLRADVIISGRNAQDITGYDAFYRAVAPLAIITSHSDSPRHEHIPKHWYQSTNALGIQIIDQRQSGAVTLTLEDNSLLLTPMLLKHKPLRLKR